MQKLVWQNANGVELDLTSGNYGITEWEGFSNTSLNIQQQQVPFQDGGVFLDALIEQRELSVTLAMQDNNNLELRYQQRRELISALNPKLGEGHLIYTNDFISKRIKCVPQIPLFETHNSDTVGTPKASLSWTACSPYWEDLEETIVNLNEGRSVNIRNSGDCAVGVKIEISHSINNTVQMESVENVITRKKIKIQSEDTLPELIDVSTEVGKKTITGLYPPSNYITAKCNGYDLHVENIIYSQLFMKYYCAGWYDDSETQRFAGIFTSENLTTWTQVYEGYGETANSSILMENLIDGHIYAFDSSYNVQGKSLLVKSSDGVTFTTEEIDGKYGWIAYNTTTGEMKYDCVFNPVTQEFARSGQTDKTIQIYKNGEWVTYTSTWTEGDNYSYLGVHPKTGEYFLSSWFSGILMFSKDGTYIKHSSVYGIYVFAYSEADEAFYGMGGYPFSSNGLVWKYYDNGSWSRIMTIENNTLYNVCYFEDYMIIGTNTPQIAKIEGFSSSNLINLLSADSDMSLGLLQGDNLLMLQSDSSCSGSVSFRQKYIGV